MRAGFSYRFSDRFLVGPGFGWFTSLDGGSSFYPILMIDWDVTERLSVSTGGGLAASQGPGITISYRVNDQLRVGVSGRKESRSFRLDEGGSAPNGIGKDRGVPLVATLEYRPAPKLRINAFAGVKFAGELSLEDAGGRELVESDYELVPIFGLSLRARF